MKVDREEKGQDNYYQLFDGASRNNMTLYFPKVTWNTYKCMCIYI